MLKINTEMMVEKVKGLSTTAKVAATALLVAGTNAMAASTATDTVIGKMTDYAVTDLWGGVGVVLAVGLPVLAGAWEAKKTNDLKPLGYGLGVGVLAASAFKIGPDLYQYIVTNVI
jgi:hypothetical protein